MTKNRSSAYNSPLKLCQISLEATLKAKALIRDNRPIDAVNVIRRDLECSLADGYDLYKRLSGEVQQEDLRDRLNW